MLSVVARGLVVGTNPTSTMALMPTCTGGQVAAVNRITPAMVGEALGHATRPGHGSLGHSVFEKRDDNDQNEK